MLPVLALSGNDYSQSSVFLLGMALGIYGLSQALLQIPFGLLSDRLGRKPLIVIGLVLFALGSLIAATADSVYGLIIGRALQGAGAIAGVIMAMVGDVTTDENRTKAMASIGASIGLAFALALVIGPWIASMEVFSVTGVRLLFWATIVLSMIGILIVLWGVPSVSAHQHRVSNLSWGHLRTVLVDQQSVLLYLGVFVLHYVLMAIFLVIPLLLEGGGIPRADHSPIYLVVMLLSFVVMVPMMVIGEKKSWVKHLFMGAISLIILSVWEVASYSQEIHFVLLALALFFVAFNYLEANLPSLLTKILPSENKGAGSGVFATCQFMGAALGGILGGSFYTSYGLTGLVVSASVLLVLWLVLARKMIIPARVR